MDTVPQKIKALFDYEPGQKKLGELSKKLKAMSNQEPGQEYQETVTKKGRLTNRLVYNIGKLFIKKLTAWSDQQSGQESWV